MIGPYAVLDEITHDLGAGTTTASYTVTVPAGARDLSHWSLQLAVCEPEHEILAISGGGGVAEDDPSTGLDGPLIKWDRQQNAGTTATYTYTVSGLWQPVETGAVMKSKDAHFGTLQAIGCEPLPAGTPEIAVDKTADVETAHVGDTITYTFDVTNPGEVPLENVALEDAKCDAGTLAGPQKLVGDDDALLEPGERWTWTCAHALVAADPDPFVNVVQVQGEGPGGDVDTHTDTDTVDIWHPQIAVEKSADRSSAHVGDTVTYTFEVTNPGDVKLTVTKFDDPKCDAGTLSGPVKSAGNGDDFLDPGEAWTWTCTRVVKADDPDPFVNVVVVEGTDPSGDPTTGTDDATDSDDTDILHPDIEVDKKQRVGSSGPFVDGAVESKVGDRLEYLVAIANTGDAGVTFQFADAGCDAGTITGPAKAGGNDDATLDPGETWSYGCSRVVRADDPNPLVNAVTLTGVDAAGGTDTGADQVSSPRPAVAVLPEVVTGCEGKPFRVFIPGRGVRRVVFLVDGKAVTTVRRRDSSGRFPFRVDPKTYAANRTHRISARLTESSGRTRTVPMRSFTSCGIGECVSRREFRIRVKLVKGGDRVVSATVLVNRKRVRVLRGKRLRAPVVLKGLPKGRFKVHIVSRTESGRTVRDTRTYHTCIPRRQRPKT